MWFLDQRIFQTHDRYRDEEVLTAYLNGETYQLEVAASREAKRQGLMNRAHLEQDQGMIFVYTEEEIRSFWMKDTLISLDMIFLDHNREIVYIEEKVPPCQEDPCSSYTSQYPSQYVIELKAGEVEKIDLSQGQRVSWHK